MPWHARTQLHTCTTIENCARFAQLQHPPRLGSVSGKAENVLLSKPVGLYRLALNELKDIMGSTARFRLQIRAGLYTFNGSDLQIRATPRCDAGPVVRRSGAAEADF